MPSLGATLPAGSRPSHALDRLLLGLPALPPATPAAGEPAVLDWASAPTLASLASCGVRVEFLEGPLVAELSPAGDALLLPRPGVGGLPLVAAETAGRWALAHRLTSGREAAGNGGIAAWRTWFTARPALRALQSDAAQLARALLEVLMPAEVAARLVELSRSSVRWPTLLESAWRTLAGGGAPDPDLALCRFDAPAETAVVLLRQSRDGLLLPIFARPEEYSFQSIYNAPHDGRQRIAHRLRASGVLLPPELFRNAPDPEDVRHVFHVPLAAASGRSVRWERAPLVDALPATVRRDLLGDRLWITRPAEGRRPPHRGYSLMIYGAPLADGTVTGRTGILFAEGRPIVVDVEGVEHIVEIKGAGAPDGGYPRLLQRTSGAWVPQGGLLATYARDEYDALLEGDLSVAGDFGVHPLAMGTFRARHLEDDPLVPLTEGAIPLGSCSPEVRDRVLRSAGERQAILLRLSPSTERLSFVAESRSLRSLSLESARRTRTPSGLGIEARIALYGQLVGELIGPPHPRAHLSAHLENAVAGDFGAFWQDHADVVPLHVSRAHYRRPDCADRARLTVALLNHTFFYVARTAQLFYGTFGVAYPDFSRLFYQACAAELTRRLGLAEPLSHHLAAMPEPLRDDRGRGITDILWREVLAPEAYRFSRRNFDLPAAVYGGAETPTWAEGLAAETWLGFLDSEARFLGDARSAELVGRAVPDRSSVAELDEDLAWVAEQRRRAEEGGAPKRVLLPPYLERSRCRPLPRKPASWHP